MAVGGGTSLNQDGIIHDIHNGKTDICHSHLKDWDLEWNKENADVIVVTELKK
ncbi:MAG: hypothetical protein NC124_20900 [Clostridium sp.]|nr:hypothetical protein [Clostridium sp.]